MLNSNVNPHKLLSSSFVQELSDTGHVGFEVIGGKDDPQFPNDPSIIVSHVTKGGPAEGKLRVNDTIMRINGVDTSNVEKRGALQALRKNSGIINLVSPNIPSLCS